jgi:hypothetical protein
VTLSPLRLVWSCLSLASLLWLSGCATAPVAATSAEVTVKGATFLTGESAQQRQRDIKEATKSTQQTSSSGVVRVVRPRVTWMGVFREGEDTRWPESSLVRQLQGKFVQKVNAKLADLKPAAIDLRTTGNGDSPASTDGLIALLALSSESRFWYPDSVVQGSNRVVVRITGQLLFIDSLAGRVAAGDLNRVGWQVVASYPIAVDMQGLSETPPGPDDEVWQRVTSEALIGTQRAPDGRALSVLDQLIDQLQSDAIAPRGRSGLAPVAVAPAEVRLGPLQAGLSEPAPEALRAWPDELGASLARFLSAGSGLYVSPYVPGGRREIRLSPVLKDAVAGFVAQRGDGQDQTVMSAELQPPSYTVHFEVSGLTQTDSIPQNPNRARIAYGFSGQLVVSQNRGAGQPPERQTWDFVLPVPEGGPLPAQLRRSYASLIDVNVMRSIYGAPPPGFHEFWWRDSLEQTLFQITREIFYPTEDFAKRFTQLRADWSRLMQVQVPGA